MTDEHRWFRARVAAHLLGVLPDGDAARFLEHASECGPCGSLLTTLERADTDWWAAAEHASVAMLGEYARDPGSMAARDRESVAAHVEQCEACRRDLDEMGGPGARTGARVHAATPVARRRRGMPGWMLGAAAGSLATAAVLLLVSPPRPAVSTAPSSAPMLAVPSSPAPAPSADAAGGSTPVPGAGHELLAGLATPVTIRGTTRAAGPETTLVNAAPGSLVPLRVPLLSAPAGTVRIRLLRGDGFVLGVQSVPGRRLVENGMVVDASGLPPGVLILRLEWAGEGGEPVVREYPLRIVRGAGR